jgi:hypothetical protein
MWNSNSLNSWLLVSAGLDISQVPLPIGGRAPGWGAGVAVAARAATATATAHAHIAATELLARRSGARL